MDIQFKFTDQPINDYQYGPIKGELVLKANFSNGQIWTRDSNNALIQITGGWDTKYQDLYFISDLTSFEDVDLTGVQTANVLRYSSGKWTALPFVFTNIDVNFFDVDFTRFNVTNSSLTSTVTPQNKQLLRSQTTQQIVTYNNRTNAQDPTSGSWTLFLSGAWYLRLHRIDSTGTVVTSRLRAMISSARDFTIVINNRRYNIVADAIVDRLDFLPSSYIELQLAPNLKDTNLQYAATIPFGPLQFITYNRISLSSQGPFLSLPDGGDFDSSVTPIISTTPDGGLVETRPGYLYTNNVGNNNSPTLPGRFAWASTNFIRLFAWTAESEPFNVGLYGGLGSPLLLAGMQIRIYGGASAGLHTLTRFSSTANWILQSGYYQVQVAQNLNTLFTGATGLQVIRPSGPFYRWVT